MAKLTYTATTSLDGFIQDVEGNLDWSVPDQEVHSFINDLLRPIGTFLFGRLMYETMVYWETANALPDQPAIATDFAEIWHAADKVVYSKTLEKGSSARTRIEQDFDAGTIRRLAAQAIKAGLVDEFHLFVVPIVIGGGKRYLPADVRLKLELLKERRFGSGTVYLQYRITN